MSEFDPQLIEEFVLESREHLDSVEAELLEIEAAGAAFDVELVNKVFRSVHSIKGNAGFFGFNVLGELAHALENVLNLMRNHELTPDSQLIGTILAALDELNQLVNNISGSNDADVSALVGKLENFLGGSPTQAATPEPTAVSPAALSEEARTLCKEDGLHAYRITFPLPAGDDDGSGIVAEVETLGTIVGDPPALTGEGAQQRFVLTLATVADPELVRDHFDVPEDALVHLFDPDAPEAEASPAPPPVQEQKVELVAPPQPPPAASPACDVAEPVKPRQEAAAPADTLRVPVHVLDRLINLAGELVLTRNRLLQVMVDQDQRELESVANLVDQVTSDLQEAVLRTRMQPIGGVFSRFQRVIRDLSEKLGKHCQLELGGKDVELDKAIIESLGDPLTHLVRNAVDHGIETPEERERVGKPITGRVALTAQHEGGKVHITLSDDGRGIDVDKLKQKAIDKGILTPHDAAQMSPHDARRLIFHPGFSTAAEVTDVSGRGVGMDVVRTNLERIGGTVELESEKGVGSTIGISLPLTLAIMPTLIVSCDGQRFAVPQVHIRELVRLRPNDPSSQIHRLKDAEVLYLRGGMLPIVRLRDVLGREPLSPEDPNRGQYVIVLEAGRLRFGLAVDSLHDPEEIVVKPLGEHLLSAKCLAGSTVLGDGSVALILDPAGIAAAAMTTPDTSEQAIDARDAEEEWTGDQRVLCFDQGQDRFGISLELVARIERIQVDMLQRVGDQEVLFYRGAELPILGVEQMIAASDRPQQDGYHVIVLDLSGREVGLVAPHLRDIAEVPCTVGDATKREPGVVGSILLNGASIRLLDVWALAQQARPDWFIQERRDDEVLPNRLLLAEDSSLFRRQMVNFLESEGFDVHACVDGAEAWRTLCDRPTDFDMLITDIEMPNMTGLELIRHIRGDSNLVGLPVIAVSSLASDEDIARGMAAGADDYQVKLDRDNLIARISEVLALRARRAEAGAS